MSKKTALVTGATSGIGLTLASRLGQEGWRVLAVGRSQEKLKALSDTYGRDAELLVADLSDENQVISLSQQVKQITNMLDLLANVAGTGIYTPLETTSHNDWRKSININLNAPFLLTKALIDLLKNTPNALVINQGSGMGVIPQAGRSPYCASKFGLRGMSLSLADEYEGIDPDIVLITLGSVLTGFGPMTIDEKQQAQLQGKAYFTVDWVVEKYLEIIESPQRQKEYVFYPSNYGPGTLRPN